MQLHRARSEIEEAGASLVFIGQASPRHAAHFRDKLGLEEPILADGDRKSYRAAGAKRGTVSELLGPKVVAKGIRATARSGVVQGRTIGDLAQLGGTMVIATDGTVAFSHMSDDASDNASPDELVTAAHSLA